VLQRLSRVLAATTWWMLQAKTIKNNARIHSALIVPLFMSSKVTFSSVNSGLHYHLLRSSAVQLLGSCVLSETEGEPFVAFFYRRNGNANLLHLSIHITEDCYPRTKLPKCYKQAMVQLGPSVRREKSASLLLSCVCTDSHWWFICRTGRDRRSWPRPGQRSNSPGISECWSYWGR